MIEYTKKDICAVVVTYNPDTVFESNIKSLSEQVDRCLVVDNGSTTPIIGQAKREFGFELLELKANRGVAYALNIGLRYCKENNYRLMLSMDQDTILDQKAVDYLLKAINNYNCVSVGINWDNKEKKDKKKKYLITSGNLFVVDTALEVGGYDEILFIDSVDFDFSLKLVDNGYQLMKIAEATAQHNIGERTEDSTYTTHSVERYYYIFRNHFYFCHKYFFSHPVFVLKRKVLFCFDVIRICIHDKAKKEKLSQMKKAYSDSRKMIALSKGAKNGER